MTGRDLRRLFLAVGVSLSCGKPVASVPAPREVRFAGTAAVRVSPARSGEWQLPGSWDGWILSSQAATGQVRYERNVDVQNGDMFWDAASLNEGRLLAVGSTNYTQNPSGLSVSDMRDSLALVLDSSGNVEKRIVLPAGSAGRGNEAMSVTVGDGVQVAISGVQNAPGTRTRRRCARGEPSASGCR